MSHSSNLEAKLMESQLTFDKEWKSYLSLVDFFPVIFVNGLMSDEMCVPPNLSRNTTILEKYVGMHGESCCCRLLKCSNFCMPVTCDASRNQLKICLSTIFFEIIWIVDVLLLRMESFHGAMTNLQFRWEIYSIISISKRGIWKIFIVPAKKNAIWAQKM